MVFHGFPMVFPMVFPMFQSPPTRTWRSNPLETPCKISWCGRVSRFFSEAPGLFTLNLWQCQEERDDQLINFGDIRWYPILFQLKPEILMSCCNFGQLFQDAHRISLTSGHHSWPRKVDGTKWKNNMTCRINSKVCAKVLSRLWSCYSCSGQVSVLWIPIEKFFSQDEGRVPYPKPVPMKGPIHQVFHQLIDSWHHS